MIHYFCIGHELPSFEPVVDYLFISPKVVNEKKFLHVPDLSLGESFNGKFLSEYTQLIALSNYLQELDVNPTDSVFIFQYRKFIALNHQGLSLDPHLFWTYLVNPKLANQYLPNQTQLALLDEKTITGPVLKIRSIVHNYAANHFIEDFSTFVLAMRETIFTAKECNQFSQSNLFIPAPSMGLFKVKFFIELIQQLTKVWKFFYENYYIERYEYQRRVGGFLLERLNSYLITEALTQQTAHHHLSGYQLTVTEESYVRQTV
jgi:hypothetical protein